jgi:ribosomal-protein-alanine N-acetyltransferase
VAYGGLMFAVDEAHVTNIAVAPEVQRRGFARRMLLRLANVAVERGFTALTLEVRVSNTAAQAMYRQFGFAPAGIRQRYYENTEDALVMWVHDIDSPEYRARLNAIAEDDR